MTQALDPIDRARTHWWGVACLFFAGLVAAMHFAKLAPIMGDVQRDLGLSLVQSAWAVSALGVVGVVFAIAAGAVVAALGLRRSLLGAVFIGAASAVVVALAAQGTVFLALRVLEGFSHLVIVIAAPALMARQTTAADRPLAMALWGCFFGLGFAMVSAVAPTAVGLWGWRGLLTGHALLMALVGGLLVHALRDQSDPALAGAHWPRVRDVLRAHLDVYRSGAPLLLALCFCAYAALFLAVLTFMGRYWIEVLGASSASSGRSMALLAMVTLFFTLFAGALVRWGVSLRAGLLCAFVLVGLSAFCLFGLQSGPVFSAISAFIMMAGFGLIPGFVFANAPQVGPNPALTYGAIAQFGNVGTFSGTPLFAATYESMGWLGAAAYVMLVAALGVGLTLALHSKQRAMGLCD